MIYLIIASVLKGLLLFLNLYSWIIVADAVFTIFTRPKNRDNILKQILRRIADPLNRVFRKALRKLSAAMPVDLSPMLSLVAIWILYQLIHQFYEHLINRFYFYYWQQFS